MTHSHVKAPNGEGGGTVTLFPLIFLLLFASSTLQPERGLFFSFPSDELERRGCEVFFWRSLQVGLSQAHRHLRGFGDSK